MSAVFGVLLWKLEALWKRLLLVGVGGMFTGWMLL